MELTFDPELDILYLHMSEAKIASSRALSAETIIDLDDRGELVGIELGRVSQWAGEDEHFHIRLDIPGQGPLELDIPFPDSDAPD